MKKEVIYWFDKNDLELLKGNIPSDPCIGCLQKDMTCKSSIKTCSFKDNYKEQMQPFAYAGIKDYAKVFDNLGKSMGEICDLVYQMQSAINNLPDELKTIVFESKGIKSYISDNPFGTLKGTAIFDAVRKLIAES